MSARSSPARRWRSPRIEEGQGLCPWTPPKASLWKPLIKKDPRAAALGRGPGQSPGLKGHGPCPVPTSSPRPRLAASVHQCTDRDGLDAALRAGSVSGYIGFDLTADCLHVRLHGADHAAAADAAARPPAGAAAGRRHHQDRRPVRQGGGAAAADAGADRRQRPGHPGDRAALRAGWRPDRGDHRRQRRLARPARLHRAAARGRAARAGEPDAVPGQRARLRLEREQGLSFLEFNYSILQSYDFRELGRRHGVSLQMGRLRPVGQHRPPAWTWCGAPTGGRCSA